MADITLAGWDATGFFMFLGITVAAIVVLIFVSGLIGGNSKQGSDAEAFGTFLLGFAVVVGGLTLFIGGMYGLTVPTEEHDEQQRAAVLEAHYDDFELDGDDFTANNDGEFIRGQFRHVEGERWKIEVYQ